MPKLKNTSTTHHCPLKTRGNCRRHPTLSYCTAHQTYCEDHDISHLQTEKCPGCQAEEVECDMHAIVHSKKQECPQCTNEKESCPKRGKTKQKCQPTSTATFWYCTTHQAVCPTHFTYGPYMNYETCPSCSSEWTGA